MKHIMDWMITEKIAKNGFNASAIVNGLELYKVEGDEAKKARVRLYRDWRNAGEPSKAAFQHAIKGDVIQALPIEGALISDFLPLWNVTYYTLSDCKASKDIRAKTSSDAEKMAREKDDTFDRLIGVSIVLEAA